MTAPLPYCGTPPAPGELLARFNLDPLLIVALLVLAVGHIAVARDRHARIQAAFGWAIAAAAFISPLCALSVALFSARVAQHMILLLAAAPLIALAMPRPSPQSGGRGLWLSASAFFIALWFWHMPNPYDATYTSTLIYWLMHVSLFGSGILLWRELLHHTPERTGEVLVAGILSSMQMGLLGAVLTLASYAQFSVHFLTTAIWHLSPLQDQELGGVIMWVPGILLFLWAAIRSLRRLWSEMEGPSAA